ncbi:MAG: hypothetical protein EZS28_008749 [Streblomastix strix]|uniref:Uncharacterized protein n=1 Tax=Streblomastix strix TaxID=222440 RepID=A0A5J4WLS2_9EUKA|nr:MAG: hypothetical protein EZS28_008749 [Streblomastix strix]
MIHHFYTIRLRIDSDQLMVPDSELDEIDPNESTTIDRTTDDHQYQQQFNKFSQLFHPKYRFIVYQQRQFHRLEQFPDPFGPVDDPTTKHIRPPPTPTSGLQPSRFSETCFALSMLRRGNALDRQIVTNGRIVVIRSFDTGISELERLTFAKSRLFSSLTLASSQCLPCLESTIIPLPAFHHQPFVEPYPNGMSVMGITKQIKLKHHQEDQPDAELEEDFELLLYRLSVDSDYRKSQYQLIKEKDDEIMFLRQGSEKQDSGIDCKGYNVCEEDETLLEIDVDITIDEYKQSVKRKKE